MGKARTYLLRGTHRNLAPAVPPTSLLFEWDQVPSTYYACTLPGDTRAMVWIPPSAGVITQVDWFAYNGGVKVCTAHFEAWTGNPLPAVQIATGDTFSYQSWSAPYDWRTPPLTPFPFSAGVKTWIALEKDSGDATVPLRIGYLGGVQILPTKAASRAAFGAWTHTSPTTTFVSRIWGYYT